MGRGSSRGKARHGGGRHRGYWSEQPKNTSTYQAARFVCIECNAVTVAMIAFEAATMPANNEACSNCQRRSLRRAVAAELKPKEPEASPLAPGAHSQSNCRKCGTGQWAEDSLLNNGIAKCHKCGSQLPSRLQNEQEKAKKRKERLAIKAAKWASMSEAEIKAIQKNREAKKRRRKYLKQRKQQRREHAIQVKAGVVRGKAVKGSQRVTTYKKRDDILNGMGYTSYAAYLESDLWRRIRSRVLLAGDECECCPEPATQLHHLSYDRPVLLGADVRSLVRICGDCHHRLEFDDKGGKRNFTHVIRLTKEAIAGKAARCVDCGKDNSAGLCRDCRLSRSDLDPLSLQYASMAKSWVAETATSKG